MRRGLVAALAVVLVLVLGGWLLVRHMLAPELVRSTIEQQLGERLGQPVHIASATASIFPRVGVNLHDVAIGAPPAVSLARVELHTGLRALLSHRIANAEVVLADGRIPWPLPFPLAAPSSGGSGTAAVTITSISRIALQNITIASSLPPLTVNLDAALHGDRVDIGQLSAQSGKTRLQATGTIDSVSRMKGTLAVKGTLEAAGYDATALSASVALASDSFTLAPLSFDTLGGRFKGRLAADLRGAAPALQLAGDVSGIDVTQAMQRSGAAGGITGTLGGQIRIAASGTDGAALLRSAHGNLNVEITNGTIPHLDLVRTVVLAFGKPAGAVPAGSGSGFESLGGPLVLANRTLSSDRLTLRSRDVDMIADARLRLDTGAVDGRVNVVLSRDLTAQAGTDLRRYASQNGRVIVPVTIAGTLGQPTVFVDPAAAAQRALENELQRRLGGLLGGLIKKKGGE
ncbi:MAG TPA: AsmA family protein [Vicinamibacterales bacterium]|nr:AsmA family protein [Vicinamibacterales bacterium]